MIDDVSVLERIRVSGVVPVAAIERTGDAHDLADALVAGGITVIEVTLRTEAALATIAALSARIDILVGAGTVLTVEDAEAAHDAGAQFMVSPGISRSVVERSLELDMLPLPGVATATELMEAREVGLSQVKLFPAKQLGGIGALDALCAPFPSMQFMPSGGVSLDDAPKYLAHRAVFAVGGSWMLPQSALAKGDFATVQQLCRLTTSTLQRRPS